MLRDDLEGKGPVKVSEVEAEQKEILKIVRRLVEEGQITMSGKGELKRLKIDPSLIVASEAEVLEDLIVAAVNDAKSKTDAHSQEEMSKLTGGLPLPPGFKLPF